MAIDILIVDDERDIRELVAGVLSDEGYECRTAGDSEAALKAVDEQRPSLVLLDVWLHGSRMDGLEVLDAIKAREPELPVIIFSGHGNIDTAVAAISRGAADFIEKPFESERLLHLVAKATETERLRRENAHLRLDFSIGEEFTGGSSSINQVRATLKRVANTGSRLLITGPAGAGKEVAARLLHSWSPRAGSAFVSVNSARITPERFEQELFGEETDGSLVRPGLLEMADGGTLYFDEIADMPLSTQARILRVLTEQAFVRVGGHRQIRVDVRVVSSTSRNLEKEIAERRFREDLFYRLNVLPLKLPPLRVHIDDVPALLGFYVDIFNREFKKNVRGASAATLRLLGSYSWPGNVRELRNAVERAMLLATGEMLEPADFPMAAAPGTSTHSIELPANGLQLEDAEKSLVLQALERTGWNQTRAAKLLGLNRDQIHYRIEKFKLTPATPSA